MRFFIAISSFLVVLGCGSKPNGATGNTVDTASVRGVADTGSAVAPDTATCAPVCGNLECGDDGCGGQCGKCPAAAPSCNGGKCVAECAASCEGKECGNDGCGGSCGKCPSAAPTCDAGTFKCTTAPCVAKCGVKKCGDDGCGGSCGECKGDQVCSAGKCKADSSCEGLTYEGCCESASEVKYCDGGPQDTKCTAGTVCGWGGKNGYYECIDPAQCVGNCSDPAGAPKVCGDVCIPMPCPLLTCGGLDNCGGICTCSAGKICESGSCVDAGKPDPCSYAPACKDDGLCTTKNGKCIAGSNVDCQQAWICQTFGHCLSSNGECVSGGQPATVNCGTTEPVSPCKFQGLCSVKSGKCVATSNADCEASSLCAVGALCTLKDGKCLIGPGDCTSTGICADEGKCSASPDGKSCIALTDADCKNSLVCKQKDACYAMDGSCAQ